MCLRLLIVILIAAAPVLTQVTEEANCGIVTPKDDLLTDSRVAKRGDLPWHANIYGKTSTFYNFLCSASLVKNNVVISVAHCFWDNVDQPLKPPSQFAVAVGKLSRVWDDLKDGDTQISDVKDIKIPPQFQGQVTNFEADISVVTVTKAFVYTVDIRPVCLNFDLSFENSQLRTGNKGKVGGWQKITTNGHSSDILKVMEIPYVDISQCFTEIPPSFREFMTSDKMCAKYGNGTNICIGESGEGLSFPQRDQDLEKYYLRGIVSVALRDQHDICNATTALVGFTQITKHESFLIQNL